MIWNDHWEKLFISATCPQHCGNSCKVHIMIISYCDIWILFHPMIVKKDVTVHGVNGNQRVQKLLKFDLSQKKKPDSRGQSKVKLTKILLAVWKLQITPLGPNFWCIVEVAIPTRQEKTKFTVSFSRTVPYVVTEQIMWSWKISPNAEKWPEISGTLLWKWLPVNNLQVGVLLNQGTMLKKKT